MSDPFEAFIEAQLNQHLAPLVGSAIPPAAGRFAAAALGAGISASAGSGLLAAFTTKTAAGIAAASLAAGGGGAVVATVTTGSSNPVVWEQQVQAAVTQCKTELSPGERGVGHCVSHVVIVQQELLPSPSPAAGQGSDMVIGGSVAPPAPPPSPKLAPSPKATPKPHEPPDATSGGSDGQPRGGDRFRDQMASWANSER
ncbi:MAG: hypothetical protein M3Z98_05825 [Candidatus Dormibacteraeota bacterium]|nr:hypothetical protein [Candidatus Dormibacteraeota bacterium]